MECLALNASFEPLTILPVQRALRLVIDSKAEILEVDAARSFRSQWQEVPCPTVIRLVRFVHVPRRFRRQVTNTFLFARDSYRCQYCGRHRSDLKGRDFLTRDHVVPISRGGGNHWQNVV
ncbi:MAG: HNH endonuclease, partial [Gemmatimonadetes bacterium]|nr:HNH endonuclease [Gemmatimonadota bacterium]